MAETNKLWISILGSGKTQIILLICANKDELIFAFLLQALMFSTTSMTGSGGFTPGTPVSTHFKRLSKKHREIQQKDIQKEQIRKIQT